MRHTRYGGRRRPTTDPFYLSARWRKTRERVLSRDDYLCRECVRYGRTTPAETVHHCVPYKDDPSRKLDTGNLVSLCHSCHNAMHDRMSDDLTALGRSWRTRAERGLIQ